MFASGGLFSRFTELATKRTWDGPSSLSYDRQEGRPHWFRRAVEAAGRTDGADPDAPHHLLRMSLPATPLYPQCDLGPV